MKSLTTCKLLASLCFFVLLFSCEKPQTETSTNTDNAVKAADPGFVYKDLTIASTQTMVRQTQQDGIVSQLKCSGPDLCYKFSHFEVKETGVREFAIRAKATYPDDQRGVVCAAAIYNFDTTVKIKATTTGRYILRFYYQAQYHSDQLFKTDTVQVN